METTLPLRRVPCPAVREVLVAVRLELLPAEAAHLGVCGGRERQTETTLTSSSSFMSLLSATKRFIEESVVYSKVYSL